jgi:hypothetical protein
MHTAPATRQHIHRFGAGLFSLAQSGGSFAIISPNKYSRYQNDDY